VHPATTFLDSFFTEENAISSLMKSSSPFFLQKLRPLTPLKATDRVSSLTFIRMTKIMCNNIIFGSTDDRLSHKFAKDMHN